MSEKQFPEKIGNLSEVVQAPDSGLENDPGQGFESENIARERGAVIEEITRHEVASGNSGNMIALTSAQQRYKEREREVEKVLEKDLADIFLSLSPAKQKEFAAQGEEVAKKINSLLEEAIIKVGKIIGLIREWLAMIPGINKFFLEQEAKIRADEIIKLKHFQ